eukprot:5773575-Prymnesium_polylepis.1
MRAAREEPQKPENAFRRGPARCESLGPDQCCRTPSLGPVWRLGNEKPARRTVSEHTARSALRLR